MLAVKPQRVRLGDWTCPSGNNVEVFYQEIEGKVGALELAWDDPPPLLAADEAYYAETILPAVLMRFREFTEHAGCTILVMP